MRRLRTQCERAKNISAAARANIEGFIIGWNRFCIINNESKI